MKHAVNRTLDGVANLRCGERPRAGFDDLPQRFVFGALDEGLGRTLSAWVQRLKVVANRTAQGRRARLRNALIQQHCRTASLENT